MDSEELTTGEVEHFLRHGYVVVKDCFNRSSAQEWIDRAWLRFGYDRDDPSQWLEKRIHLSALASVDAREFAPKVFAAAVQLLGGEERFSCRGAGRTASLRTLASETIGLGPRRRRSWRVGTRTETSSATFWIRPSRDSLPSCCGPICTIRAVIIAPDSVRVIARFLADHAEGVLPDEFDFSVLIRQCQEFAELTGDFGDVVLMHPYMLHATSQNVIQHGRLITNPPIALREPMRFNRKDSAEFSAVETAVLRALGVDRFDFQRTGERGDRCTRTRPGPARQPPRGNGWRQLGVPPSPALARSASSTARSM